MYLTGGIAIDMMEIDQDLVWRAELDWLPKFIQQREVL